MIQPDDWAVILRWPRLTSILEHLVIIMLPAVVLIGCVALLNLLSPKKLQRAHFAAIGGVAAGAMTALAMYSDFNLRAWQAACWRLGPEGMPYSERERCERMPPQGVESYYRTTMFGPS